MSETFWLSDEQFCWLVTSPEPNARPPAPRKPRKQAWPAGSHGAIGWLGGVWNAMPTNQPTLSNGQVSRRLLRGLRGSTMLARSGPQNSATLPTGLNPPPPVSK